MCNNVTFLKRIRRVAVTIHAVRTPYLLNVLVTMKTKKKLTEDRRIYYRVKNAMITCVRRKNIVTRDVLFFFL